MELFDGTPRNNYCFYRYVSLSTHFAFFALNRLLFAFYCRTPLRIPNVLPMQSVGIIFAAISAAVASTVSKCVAPL